ncbi:hypothetical protein PR202_ga12763 [Eleusine coracana subsp. coracana]|uniref:Major facilitator superfamily (MFS) profile domain-containing protein n=1 Tax=Eleusine coracana subsp. coracana TaxID=191504 RepID=A0AAV5CD12_ELECO|nr:hypothetical protein PR202_ga12763 [Eleusine coracana subsp. coracana]
MTSSSSPRRRCARLRCSVLSPLLIDLVPVSFSCRATMAAEEQSEQSMDGRNSEHGRETSRVGMSCGPCAIHARSRPGTASAICSLVGPSPPVAHHNFFLRKNGTDAPQDSLVGSSSSPPPAPRRRAVDRLLVVLSALSWRWLLAFTALPCFLLLPFFGSTSESPRYLCVQNRMSDATAVLEKIAIANQSALPPGVLTYYGDSKDDHDSLASENEYLLDINEKECAVDNAMSSNSGTIAALRKLLSRKLLKSTLLIWFAFFANSFAYYGLVLLTSELSDLQLAGFLLVTGQSIDFQQVYPTSVRSTGVGIATAIGRIGGVVCPIIAVAMLRGCHQMEAIMVFELVLVLAGITCMFFPVETKGRDMD